LAARLTVANPSPWITTIPERGGSSDGLEAIVPAVESRANPLVTVVKGRSSLKPRAIFEN